MSLRTKLKGERVFVDYDLQDMFFTIQMHVANTEA